MCAIEFASKLLMFSTSSWNLCSSNAKVCLDFSDKGGKGRDCPLEGLWDFCVDPVWDFPSIA
jgi:hypothetical protein